MTNFNKNKYFTVQTTAVVSAPNKTIALQAAASKRPVSGTRVLTISSDVERVPAATAHTMSA